MTYNRGCLNIIGRKTFPTKMQKHGWTFTYLEHMQVMPSDIAMSMLRYVSSTIKWYLDMDCRIHMISLIDRGQADDIDRVTDALVQVCEV